MERESEKWERKKNKRDDGKERNGVKKKNKPKTERIVGRE